MAEVNDFRGVVVSDQAVKQRHLTRDIADRGLGRMFGQELRKRPFAGIEIESCDRASLIQVKVCNELRGQSFAYARSRRRDTMMELRNDIT